MANSLIEQILAGVLSHATRGRGQPGADGPSLDGGAGGGLGDLLGGMLGRGGAPAGAATERSSPFGGGGGALLAMLLPLAMQWVQRNGGLGAVLGKFPAKRVQPAGGVLGVDG